MSIFKGGCERVKKEKKILCKNCVIYETCKRKDRKEYYEKKGHVTYCLIAPKKQ